MIFKFKKFMLLLICVILAITTCAPSTTAKAGNTFDNLSMEWGQKNSGTVDKRIDRYSYNFSLQKSGRLTINYWCDNENDTVNNTTSWFYVFDTVRNKMASFRMNKGNHSAYVDLVAGDYYLDVVGSQYGVTINFNFTTKFSPANETIAENTSNQNNYFEKASSYSLGKSFRGQIAKNDKVDIYKFRITKNSFVNITLDNRVPDMAFAITDTKELFDYHRDNVSVGKKTYRFYASKGDYYLTLKSESGTGTYAFKITTPDVPQPRVTAIRNSAKGTIRFTWTKKSDILGYKLQVSSKSNFSRGYTRTITLNSPKITSRTEKKLKKGKVYYVRVSTFSADQNGGLHFSKWSKTVKVRVRK